VCAATRVHTTHAHQSLCSPGPMMMTTWGCTFQCPTASSKAVAVVAEAMWEGSDVCTFCSRAWAVPGRKGRQGRGLPCAWASQHSRWVTTDTDSWRIYGGPVASEAAKAVRRHQSDGRLSGNIKAKGRYTVYTRQPGS
jgi:hypothetical protein